MIGSLPFSGECKQKRCLAIVAFPFIGRWVRVSKYPPESGLPLAYLLGCKVCQECPQGLNGKNCLAGINGRAAMPIRHRNQWLTRHLPSMATSLADRAAAVASKCMLAGMRAQFSAHISSPPHAQYDAEQFTSLSITTRLTPMAPGHPSQSLKFRF